MLVAAHRAESARHEAARRSLKALAEGAESWAIPVFCLAEFLRVVTHPKVFTPPSGIEVALDFIAALLGSPTVRLLSPGPRFADLFDRCVREAEARGNLAFDAQIAAVCLEQGARDIWTFDRDFSRFRELRPNRELR